jgi:hypothetical protein
MRRLLLSGRKILGVVSERAEVGGYLDAEATEEGRGQGVSLYNGGHGGHGGVYCASGYLEDFD